MGANGRLKEWRGVIPPVNTPTVNIVPNKSERKIITNNIAVVYIIRF